MPRFVLLEHDHPFLHWDLMLEAGEVLQTWRLAQAPAPGVAIEATALGDHRLIYLEYEGPVSGDRGVVKRWDAGEFTEDAGPNTATRTLMVRGSRIQGKVELKRAEADRWTFLWRE